MMVLLLLQPEAVGAPWAFGTWVVVAPVPTGDSNGASCYASVGSRAAGLLA